MTANSEQVMSEVWIQFATVVGANEPREETLKLVLEMLPSSEGPEGDPFAGFGAHMPVSYQRNYFDSAARRAAQREVTL